MSDPASAGTGIALCRLDEIADGAARDFVFGEDTQQVRLFVLRRGAGFVAYVNVCPHIGTPLNILPGRFLGRGGKEIVCATHGAQFRIEDGFCTDGPCEGKSLTPAAVTLEKGVLTFRP
jgi:nitrite reductase/ring-hydroxylating ferredoxin subunit